MSKGFTKISVVIGIAIAILAGIFLATNVFATESKVNICHNTGSQQHPWEAIRVDTSAFDGQGQNDHTLHGDFLYSGPVKQNGHPNDAQGQDDTWCNNHVPEVTPTPTPSIEPTVTPTPTDEPTVTPTPTDTPKEVCEDESATNYGDELPCKYPEEEVCPEGTHPRVSLISKDVEFEDELVCDPDVTPTPTPEVCQFNCGGGGDQPTFAGSSTNPPVCTDGNTVQLPANPHVYRNGESATVNFFITQGDSANVYWRVVGQSDWQNALSDLKPNGDKFVSVTIHGLDPKLGYDFGIQQVQGCGGGQLVTAVIVDGPQPVLFKFSYWEWSK